jgi:hypothetical protein
MALSHGRTILEAALESRLVELAESLKRIGFPVGDSKQGLLRDSTVGQLIGWLLIPNRVTKFLFRFHLPPIESSRSKLTATSVTQRIKFMSHPGEPGESPLYSGQIQGSDLVTVRRLRQGSSFPTSHGTNFSGT